MFYNKTTINVLYVLLPVLYSLLENAKDYLSPPLLLLSHVTSRHLTFINLYSKCSRETVNCHHFLTIASDERSRALQNTVFEMKNFFKSFRQNLISILKRGANRSFFNFAKGKHEPFRQPFETPTGSSYLLTSLACSLQLVQMTLLWNSPPKGEWTFHLELLVPIFSRI